jgi:chemotaxis protein methyltransferase CheR
MSDLSNALFAQPDLSPQLARQLVSRAERISGVKIDAEKTEFVKLRLGRRLQVLGLRDFNAYQTYLSQDSSGTATRHLVEALTTHTTSFFREIRHYDWLENQGLDLMLGERPPGPFLIWSAAASLGAELWSAGMLMHDRSRAGKPPADWRLIGTDISERILKRAQAATYTEDELNGLSDSRAERFLLRSRKPYDHNIRPIYRIIPELRARARFKKANLQDLSLLEPFTADVVFLRNVLIYFEPEAQRRVVEAVIDRIRPGGVLMTGHSETLQANDRLSQVLPTIYRKV